MKKHLILLAAACLLMTNAFAQQSETQKEWVPTHEFQLQLFGGFSNLNYKVDPSFMNVKYNFADAMAGGLGFGYTWHANDWFGITTGVEFALYRGGFTAINGAVSFAQVNDDGSFAAVSWSAMSYELTLTKNYATWHDLTFSETQNVYAAQIPIMAQFMVPLNARKSHHFYAAVGAKVGFNIYGDYSRSNITAVTGPEPHAGRTSANGTGPYAGKQAYMVAEDVHMIGDTFDPSSNQYRDAAGNDINPSQLNMLHNLALITNMDYTENEVNNDSWLRKDINGSGKMGLNLIQVLASAELGFRWGFGRGWGLYTGLYFDYGFMPMLKQGNRFFTYSYTVEPNPVLARYHHASTFHSGSMLECTYDDPGIQATDAGVWSLERTKQKRNQAIAERVGNIGAGLKLRLAFGSAKPKPAPEPVIQYVERIVRDTVTVVNTVVQKDTVTNTVVVRDTVTVIKEVPVEIQKVMTDLSNSLFDSGKAIIKDQAKGPLYTVVMWLKENPNAKVEVSGHTDNVGGAAYNQKLSEARAKAVYDYFIANGVNADRLSYAGYGMERPIATNDTPEGRQQNRRVELNLVE